MAALQDLYPDDDSHRYRCGRLNSYGLHVKSEWHEGEASARAGEELQLRSRPAEVGERKITVNVEVPARGEHVVRARVIAVRLPEHMMAKAT